MRPARYEEQSIVSGEEFDFNPVGGKRLKEVPRHHAGFAGKCNAVADDFRAAVALQSRLVVLVDDLGKGCLGGLFHGGGLVTVFDFNHHADVGPR